MCRAHLLALGRPSPLSHFQTLLAWLVVRLGHGLGLSGDTPCCPISVPLSCVGLGLCLGARAGDRGKDTSVFNTQEDAH